MCLPHNEQLHIHGLSIEVRLVWMFEFLRHATSNPPLIATSTLAESHVSSAREKMIVITHR